MKNIKVIVATLLVSLLMSTVASAATFQDVSKSASYAKAVDYVSSAGLMVGYGDGTFQPDKAVTRAEMATVLCKILGADKNLEKNGEKFWDVPTSHWGNGYIVKAADLGVVTGYGNGKFGPDETVTYEQALTMMVNALKLGDFAGKLGGYPDGYIAVADGYGLLEGVTSQKGKPQTRGEVAVMLMNYRDASTGSKLGVMGKGHYRNGDDYIVRIAKPNQKDVYVELFPGDDFFRYDWDAVIAGNGIFLESYDGTIDGYVAFRSKSVINIFFNKKSLHYANGETLQYASQTYKSDHWD